MSSTNLPEKWIVGLDPAGAVAQQAPQVLQKRLEAVADRVRDVIKSAGRSDEAVHQLRVSTRRAQATMVSFKPWLKKSRRRRVKKALRRLRETAGTVRMCDVHRGLLRAVLADTSTSAPDRAIVEFALTMLARERDIALATLVRTAQRVPLGRLTASAARLIRDPHDDADDDELGSPGESGPRAGSLVVVEPAASMRATVRTAGHAALAALAQEFREAGAADLTCRENLHQLRLCGKRLRYALEIFGAAEEDPALLAKLADHFTNLQERLGEVNDHHEVAERVRRYAADAAGAVIDDCAVECVLAHGQRTLADRFEQRCAVLAGEFLQWWRSGDVEELHRLIDMLAGREADLTHEPPAPEIVVLAGNNQVHGEALATSAVAAPTTHDNAGDDAGDSESEAER